MQLIIYFAFTSLAELFVLVKSITQKRKNLRVMIM